MKQVERTLGDKNPDMARSQVERFTPLLSTYTSFGKVYALRTKVSG